MLIPAPVTPDKQRKLNTHAPWFPSAVHAQSPPVLLFEKPHYGQACSAPTNTCFTQPAVVTTESAAASTPASLLFLWNGCAGTGVNITQPCSPLGHNRNLLEGLEVKSTGPTAHAIQTQDRPRQRPITYARRAQQTLVCTSAAAQLVAQQHLRCPRSAPAATTTPVPAAAAAAPSPVAAPTTAASTTALALLTPVALLSLALVAVASSTSSCCCAGCRSSCSCSGGSWAGLGSWCCSSIHSSGRRLHWSCSLHSSWCCLLQDCWGLRCGWGSWCWLGVCKVDQHILRCSCRNCLNDHWGHGCRNHSLFGCCFCWRWWGWGACCRRGDSPGCVSMRGWGALRCLGTISCLGITRLNN